MRVVYLFMSKSSCPDNSWNPGSNCAEYFTDEETGIYSEGTFYMLVSMLRHGIIDDLTVFYESCNGTGKADWGYGIKGYVVPHVKHIDGYLRKDDVIYARGGFRSWHDWLVSKKDKHWLINYSANTGRQRWKFWDIIFWDLEKVNKIDRLQRYWMYFRKPTHPKLFYPIFDQKPIYDVCIGSSHIHDKKGQWRVVNALLEHRNMFGTELKAVLPGAARRGVKSSSMYQMVKNERLNIDVVGMLPRNKMAERVYNASKVAVFMGTHGQNDRGPLEALACGTPLIIGSPRYHSPVTYENSNITMVPSDIDDPGGLIMLMRESIKKWNFDKRKKVYEYFVDNCGLHNIILPEMGKLFDIIRKNPKPCLAAKQEIQRAFS